MKLVIVTQVFENYGAHEWDGTGDCPQYWKAKGGDEYVFVLGQTLTGDVLTAAVSAATALCEQSDDYYRESATEWYVLEEGGLTQWERNQLEFDGKIDSPSLVRTLEGF